MAWPSIIPSSLREQWIAKSAARSSHSATTAAAAGVSMGRATNFRRETVIGHLLRNSPIPQIGALAAERERPVNERQTSSSPPLARPPLRHERPCLRSAESSGLQETA